MTTLVAEQAGYADDLKARLGGYESVEALTLDDAALGRIIAGKFPGNATTAAYAASLTVKAAPGTLYGFSGYNSSASAQFIQAHDVITLPADTAVPVFVMTVPGLSNFSVSWGTVGRWFGRRFNNGIVLCNSSTGPTKTIGSANCWFDAQYL